MKHFLAILAISGCHHIKPAPKPVETHTCESACLNMTVLGCELSKPTGEGSTCAEVCKVVESGPSAIHWDVACLSEATECTQCLPH